jgi:hypothetical protein
MDLWVIGCLLLTPDGVNLLARGLGFGQFA